MLKGTEKRNLSLVNHKNELFDEHQHTSNYERIHIFNLKQFLLLTDHINKIDVSLIKLAKLDLKITEEQEDYIVNNASLLTEVVIPNWVKYGDQIVSMTIIDPILSKKSLNKVYFEVVIKLDRNLYFMLPLLTREKKLLLKKTGLSFGNHPENLTDCWYHRNNLLYFGFYYFFWSNEYSKEEVGKKVTRMLLMMLMLLFDGTRPGKEENVKDTIKSFFESLAYFVGSTKSIIENNIWEALNNVSTEYSILLTSDAFPTGTVENLYFEKDNISALPKDRNLTSEMLLTLCKSQPKNITNNKGYNEESNTLAYLEKKMKIFEEYNREGGHMLHSKQSVSLIKFVGKKKNQVNMGNSSFHESLRTGGDNEIPVLITPSIEKGDNPSECLLTTNDMVITEEKVLQGTQDQKNEIKEETIIIFETLPPPKFVDFERKLQFPKENSTDDSESDESKESNREEENKDEFVKEIKIWDDVPGRFVQSDILEEEKGKSSDFDDKNEFVKEIKIWDDSPGRILQSDKLEEDKSSDTGDEEEDKSSDTGDEEEDKSSDTGDEEEDKSSDFDDKKEFVKEIKIWDDSPGRIVQSDKEEEDKSSDFEKKNESMKEIKILDDSPRRIVQSDRLASFVVVDNNRSFDFSDENSRAVENNLANDENIIGKVFQIYKRLYANF